MNQTQEQTNHFALWHPDASRNIIKRIVVEGTLTLKTPAHLGTGEQSGTELIILRDALEGRPLLTGATIAGALRHYLIEREFGYRYNGDITNHSHVFELFGDALDENLGRQSRVYVDDALGEGLLEIRDGVMLDDKTRTAQDQALFSTQVWKRGTTFNLHIELVIHADSNNLQAEEIQSNRLQTALAGALNALGSGEIPLGTRKHRGYGRAEVNDWNVQIFDMRQPSDLIAWLSGKPLSNQAQSFFSKIHNFVDERHYFRVNAKLNLCDSILIRADSDVADVTHLTSDDEPVVSGTSIAGAIRARALKIAQSLPNGLTVDDSEKDERNRGEQLIDDCFGHHGTTKLIKDDNMTASRLLVEEHLIDNPHFNHIQNRVKIDRFTGGAFDTALFDEQPVFATDDTTVTVSLELRIAQSDKLAQAQIGLLLLILKDLWLEDSSIGGESSIGRGRLRGQSATIIWKSENGYVECKFDTDGLVETEHAQVLQDAVTTLWDYIAEVNYG